MTKAFKVRKRKRDSNGGFDYVADFGLINGKRKTIVRTSESALDKAAKVFLKEHERLGVLAEQLTSNQLADAVVAIGKLEGISSLTEAAEFYRTNNTFSCDKIVRDVISELAETMMQKNRRHRSIESARFSLIRFSASLFNRFMPICWVKQKHIDAYLLNRTNNSFTTQANDITYLKQLFNFAHKRGYIKDNPTSHLEKPTIERKMPVFMQADDVERFMHWIEDNHSEFNLAFALLFFAGIRPNELTRMFDKGFLITTGATTITIDAAITKTRNARVIDVSDNLSLWMNTHQLALTYVYGNIRDEIRKEACEALNIKWSNDIARKTYATYHLAMYQDAAKTAHQMGHTRGVELLYTNYRGLADKKSSEQFWSIVPKKG